MIGFAYSKWDGCSFWNCKCNCGKKTAVRGAHLKSGATKSCGCLRREVTSKRRKIHGASQTTTYRSWFSMKNRCQNTQATRYKHYGARGIRVCKKWKTFEGFFSDMGDRPLRHSLGRINNNKGYSKKNCRWETQTQQMRNTRGNLVFKHNGESRCLADWAERCGIKRETIVARVRRGWSFERAISESIRG